MKLLRPFMITLTILASIFSLAPASLSATELSENNTDKMSHFKPAILQTMKENLQDSAYKVAGGTYQFVLNNKELVGTLLCCAAPETSYQLGIPIALDILFRGRMILQGINESWEIKPTNLFNTTLKILTLSAPLLYAAELPVSSAMQYSTFHDYAKTRAKGVYECLPETTEYGNKFDRCIADGNTLLECANNITPTKNIKAVTLTDFVHAKTTDSRFDTVAVQEITLDAQSGKITKHCVTSTFHPGETKKLCKIGDKNFTLSQDTANSPSLQNAQRGIDPGSFKRVISLKDCPTNKNCGNCHKPISLKIPENLSGDNITCLVMKNGAEAGQFCFKENNPLEHTHKKAEHGEKKTLDEVPGCFHVIKNAEKKITVNPSDSHYLFPGYINFLYTKVSNFSAKIPCIVSSWWNAIPIEESQIECFQ